jgi:hypothetical protein
VIATDRRDCRCACERWETLIVDLSALLGGHYYHRHDIQIMAVGLDGAACVVNILQW